MEVVTGWADQHRNQTHPTFLSFLFLKENYKHLRISLNDTFTVQPTTFSMRNFLSRYN